jgi:hypothetical protein
MLSRVFDFFQSAQGQVRVDKVSIASNKAIPLLISRHSDRTAAKLLDCGIHLVRVALEDAGESIVGFLDFANNDRLKLAPGVLEVEVGLYWLAQSMYVATVDLLGASSSPRQSDARPGAQLPDAQHRGLPCQQ